MDQRLFRSLRREQGPLSWRVTVFPAVAATGGGGGRGGRHSGAQEHGQSLPGHAMCCGQRPCFIGSQIHTFPVCQRLGNWDVSSMATRSREIG